MTHTTLPVHQPTAMPSYIPLPPTPPGSPPPQKPSPSLSPHAVTVASFFLLGIGSLLPWCAFLSTLDYYTLVFPTISVTQYITNAFTFPFMLTGIYISLSPNPPPRRFAILSSFVILTLFSLLLPAMVHATEPVLNPFSTTALWLTIITSVSIAIASAVLQSTIFALLANFPGGKCTTAYTSGGGVASVLIAALRILCRLLMESGGNSVPSMYALHRGFQVFFIACALICAVCLAMSVWLEFACYEYRKRVAEGDAMGKEGGGRGWEEIQRTMEEMKGPGVWLMVSMALTLSVFPAIVVKVPVTMKDGMGEGLASWYPLVVITLFAIGDTIGKGIVREDFVARWPAALGLLVSGRIVTVPLYLLVWGGLGNVGLLESWILVLLLGLSSGPVITMGFLSLGVLVPAERGEIGGRLMFLMLICGLSIGNITGWLTEAALKLVIDF